MNNVLYEALPTEWNGYQINTGFHIGVQISLLVDDETVNARMRSQILVQLLFGNEDGSIREFPETMEEIEECMAWFLGGWHHDKTADHDNHEKIMDYDIDQGRIFADFMHLYRIDLEKTDMHWWKFNWLLWNMPREQSSFMQVIEIRTKKPSKNASAEERKAIIKGKEIYGLEERKKKKYTDEQVNAIDSFDSFMKKAKQNK